MARLIVDFPERPWARAWTGNEVERDWSTFGPTLDRSRRKGMGRALLHTLTYDHAVYPASLAWGDATFLL